VWGTASVPNQGRRLKSLWRRADVPATQVGCCGCVRKKQEGFW
jgi:hypothetical protein